MNFKRLLVLSTLLIVSCRGWGSSLVTDEDFEPQLHVMGIMTPDNGGETMVRILQTIPLEGGEFSEETYSDTHFYRLYYEDSTFVDTFRVYNEPKSNFEVWDALAILSDGSWVDTLVLKDMLDSTTVNMRQLSAFMYVPSDPDFVPIPGNTYTLDVQTPDGLHATASTTVPLVRSTFVNSDVDSVRMPDDLRVEWTESTGFYRVFRRRVEGTLCIEYQANKDVGLTDTRLTMLFEECRNDYNGDIVGEDEIKFAEERLVLMTLDENYYDFYYGSNTEGAFDFFFLGQGTPGHSAGVEGGLGVFGSYRADSMMVYVR